MGNRIAQLRVRAREERGSAMVEFALLAPVLLLIVFAILYFGRFLNYSNQETHLAEEAARYAAVSQTPAGCASSTIAQCVKDQTAGEFHDGSGDVPQAAKVCIALGTGSTGQVGDPIVATVTANFKLLPIVLGTTLQTTQTATMRLEQTPAPNVIGCSS